MVNSITYMFREISVTQQIPNQWKTMRIKSIHKKGSKLLMDNKIGIFLTNILSKLYEKVLDLLTTENVKINEHGDHQYDVIATKIVSTLLPNNHMFFIVKLIMKIISSDVT